MLFANSRNRYVAILLSLLVITGLLLAIQPAPAEPGGGNASSDPEGGSASLRKQLEEASKGYTDAQAKLNTSRERHQKIGEEMGALEQRTTDLNDKVNKIANEVYQNKVPLEFAAALDSKSLTATIDRMAFMEQLNWSNERKIADLKDSKTELAKQKKQLDEEIRKQEEQEKEMAKRKEDAEKALAAVGGNTPAPGPGNSNPDNSNNDDNNDNSAPTVQSAQKNPDGTWPDESCSVQDPTASGCLTPRTKNALDQARAAGFTRYTACFRQSSSGEHPLGRACDFSAAESTFGGIATGGEKTYGDQLASWFIANANQLGVLYVIWYQQIWLPSTGWRAYSGDGTPSGNHTNHVHLSMQ